MGDKPKYLSTDCSSEAKKEENRDEYFVWQDYLEATNSKEVPQILFSHVEQSLLSGFQEGMKVEVPLKDGSENYWVATIIAACGPLLSLRYFGEKEDRSKDFWCDTSKNELRPLGWSESNNRELVPPSHLKDTISHLDLKTKLKGAHTIPDDLISCDGFSPIDRLKQGMKVEVQDRHHPYHLWTSTVVESIGGRLLLRYDVPKSTPVEKFWLFYLSPRIFPHGWAARKGSPWKLEKPSCYWNLKSNEKDWQKLIDSVKEETSKSFGFSDLFQNDINKIPAHGLSEGMKLEAVHPNNKAEICPASIMKVFDDKYFVVAIDEMNRSDSNNDGDNDDDDDDDDNDSGRSSECNKSKLKWLSTLLDPFILPIGWSKSHNFKLTHPCGWISAKEEFDWDEYLEITKSVAAPVEKIYKNDIAKESGFELAMKLEVVDPEDEHQVCAATIANVTEHLIWVHLDSNDCFHPSVIFSIDSLEMFPVGWCDMNNYTLKPPQSYQSLSTRPSSDNRADEPEQNVVKLEDNREKQKDSSKSSFWCPKIYFNHKCFSGPFLSKGKLAQLPKAVGPGPVTLVMKEVLSMLITVAYISSRVLRELQCKSKPRPGMHLEVLKAKYKMNAYRANVEIVTSADKVADFCKEICQKLQVCPFMFGPVAVGEKSCPENCSTLSKTRFCKRPVVGSNNVNTDNSNFTSTSNLVKKVIAPDDSNSSNMSRTGDRLFPWARKKRPLEKMYISGYSGKENEENNSSKRVRYETRGVKLPNFGLKKSNCTPSSNGSNGSITTNVVIKAQSHHSPSGSETSSVAELPLTSVLPTFTVTQTTPVKKKRGRHSKAKKEELRKDAELASDSRMDDSLYQVDSNPLLWTVEDVYDYLRTTDDCDVLANLLKEEEFDGKSFMLLNLPSCLESLKLNLKTALSLCRHVEAVKYTFFYKYVIPTTSTSQLIDEMSSSLSNSSCLSIAK